MSIRRPRRLMLDEEDIRQILSGHRPAPPAPPVELTPIQQRARAIKAFGTLIQQARRSSGLTVAQFSAQIGMPRSRVRDVERGYAAPFEQRYDAKIASILGVDVVLLEEARERNYQIALARATPPTIPPTTPPADES